jgi:fumarate reductase subunit C
MREKGIEIAVVFVCKYIQDTERYWWTLEQFYTPFLQKQIETWLRFFPLSHIQSE